MTVVTNLKCEYRSSPLGIGVRQPRLSWQLASDRRGAAQTAYQLRAAGDAADLAAGRNLLRDSGQVASDQSILVPYGGPALVSGQRVYWQARAWYETGAASPWSEAAWWEMEIGRAHV